MYTQRNAITPQSHRNHNNIVMEIGTMMKYILIAVLILAGYYVVSSTAFKPREGFSLGSGSSETPAVTAKKSSDVLTDNTKSIVGFLQINDNRANYEALLEVMDAWTQAKIVASMNALSTQMNADSNDPSSTPSDKTVALMNSLVTMTNFQTTVVPAAFKYLDGTS
jgi:hypothetical protein